eukprot:6769284-Prymnesium_polylepis.2
MLATDPATVAYARDRCTKFLASGRGGVCVRVTHIPCAPRRQTAQECTHSISVEGRDMIQIVFAAVAWERESCGHPTRCVHVAVKKNMEV